MAVRQTDFDEAFESLTRHRPFPWQAKLYERFMEGDLPSLCDLPTGVGKTSVIAVWLIARATGADVPRRLAYVVNRRTVVDQTTNEAIKLKENASNIGIADLAVSTLRGQFADNHEWSMDPSLPAVICGTVDMIGSRLLFSGYRIGYKSRPLHAGFLGQDVLLVHDEAHLEPAFQSLIQGIQSEQDRCKEFTRFHVMALSATGRGENKEGLAESSSVFRMTPEESSLEPVPHPPTHPIHQLRRRLSARKSLRLHEIPDDKPAKRLVALASKHKDTNAAVLIYVRSLEDAGTVATQLKKTSPVVVLTGTMRGKERDELIETPEFRRFFHGAKSGETVYLVSTSAGEVGIDISADHMVCDLSTFDSMAQRLGRVHRYGEPVEHVAQVDVVHPRSFGKLDKKTGELKASRSEIDPRRGKTLELLQRLPSLEDHRYDAGPRALAELRERSDLPYPVEDAFASKPTILPATDILFDAWALTSVRRPIPGRQPVAPFLHGIAEWEPPETHVAWRDEVEVLADIASNRDLRADLLEDYPLKPHELLLDRSDRVFKHLQALSKRHAEKPVWIIDDRGSVDASTLGGIVDQGKEQIYGCTLLLPPGAGGLEKGLLDGSSPQANDVSEIPSERENARLRIRADDPQHEARAAGMRRVRSIEVPIPEDPESAFWVWEWYVRFPADGGRTAQGEVAWSVHVGDVVSRAKKILAGLSLPEGIAKAVFLAAELHDHGKRRERFQVTLGNRQYPDLLLAKSDQSGARLPEPFRHEFASVLDAQADPTLSGLTEETRDLTLHLIAAHHGRARPHFPPGEAFDPERSSTEAAALAVETPRRFARLQRRYGRWGLAYIESLLRAADWAASAEPSEFVTAEKEASR